MDNIRWDITEEDRDLMKEIMSRLVRQVEVKDYLGISMDLIACHLNGCFLDLPALLVATDTSFIHDVTGISRHIDKKTGVLADCFIPHCAG